MSITYPPEMLPRADEDAKVIVCSNSECCLRAENERLRAALEPFADVGRPLVKACETGAIPNGASARYLKLDPLIANDFANAATAFDAAA